MRIEHIELYNVAIPLTEPFCPTWMPGVSQTSNRFTLLRLTTDEGVVGESAGTAAVQGLGTTISRYLIGRDPCDIEGLLDVLQGAVLLGPRLAWLEPALWDILGKVCGQPVVRLLGSNRRMIRAYCSTGELRPAEQRVEDALKLKDMGFRAVKLRFHSHDLRGEIRVAEEVRRAVGDDFDIMVDANQGWHVRPSQEVPRWDVKTAASVAKELEKLNVYWLEEPLDRGDYDGMRELRAGTNVRIAGGELNSRLQEFTCLVNNRCLDVLQPDATFVGGISTSRKIAAMCEANGLGFAPHTWSNGIGLLINMHVMASTPTCGYCEFPFDPPGWTIEARDGLLANPIEIDREGYVTVPDKPGLGLEIDPDKLAMFGEKVFEM
jgi:L-alanine-DL-glutamate epimerase-like enolase superfamily enzyme